MALNKQIWLNTIVENFYPDNSFASKSIDDSTFVSYKTVHIPNAGTPSGVEINRTKKPASVSQRTDNELTYDMDELTTNPIYIPNIDTVELSYDKRNSVLSNDRQQSYRRWQHRTCCIAGRRVRTHLAPAVRRARRILRKPRPATARSLRKR